MGWRQYDSLIDDLKNVAYKLTIAPIIRKINSSKRLNHSGFLPKRIVICGSPRSGTTLMNELLRCYDDVHVMNREEYALRFPYLILKKQFIATKHPLDFNNFSSIINTFQEPLIIYMLRDPRDVIISKHYKNKDFYLITYPTWQEAITAYEGLDYDKKLLIKYEDLIENPEAIQRQISEAANLNIKGKFEEFYKSVDNSHQDIKSLGGVRPIDPNNFGKFMRPEHFQRIQQQLRDFPSMSDYLIKYGYEKDRSWEQHFLENEAGE